MLRVLNPNSRKIAPIFGKKRAIKQKHIHIHTHMLHPDVSLKLTLATATILAGYALRVASVVTRENGESLLAVVFGILLPSLLIQVRRRGAWNLGTNLIRALVETRNRALSSSSRLLCRRLASLRSFLFFFARACRFLSGQTRARTLTFLYSCVCYVYTHV